MKLSIADCRKTKRKPIAREGKSVNIIMFASKDDCLELFASEGDFVSSTGYSFCSVTSMAGD